MYFHYAGYNGLIKGMEWREKPKFLVVECIEISWRLTGENSNQEK